MFALLTLAGCASPGPLRAPSLHLPAAVRGVTAERVGDEVTLQWTAPTRTTDGVSLTGRHGAAPLAVEICRDLSRSSAACTPIARVRALPGDAGTFHDRLPPPLTTGAAQVLYYRLRVVNAAAKGAAYTPVETLAGSAPLPVTSLRAEPVVGGVALRWQPDPGAAGDRTLLRVTRGDPKSPGKRSSSPGDLLSVEAGAQDPGGAVDSGAKLGTEQRYIVYRVHTVRLGGHDYTMSGTPETVTVAAGASPAPPPPPEGLEAIATTLASPEIDLVWQPSAGAAGYRVFRATGDSAPVLLTPDPIPGLTYADHAVQAGARYRYSVSAVGPKGAEGRKSAEITEAIPGR